MVAAVEGLASRLVEELAGRYTQHRRVLRLSTPAGDDVLLAESLRGEEGIDAGFRFQVAALALDDGISLRKLIGQQVLLELQTAGPSGRPRRIHGHATAVELAGANGGLARYLLTIEPWTAFLALGRDSRVFQDRTVFDILDTVFRAYDGKGQLAPAWRFDIRDRSLYPLRSLTTQYQESDLAFATRLMHEEGLFYFFEHGQDCHTLVIADHNDAFLPNAQADVRFTQPGTVMREDSLDRWRSELRLQTNAIDMTSWDYRARTRRDVTSGAGDGDILASRDAPGAYAYASMAQGQRMADNLQQGLQARQEVFVGAGTVRTFVPGTTFTLHDHALHDGGDASRFLILRVCHLAHNNLSADTGAALTRLLGTCNLATSNDADLASSLHAAGRGIGERPVYRNRIDAMRGSVAYRPDGAVLHPRPVVRGQQTAIVVGPPGAVIHTDRDHRIKVQFHWQRGGASHSRLDHPSPDGHSGAPADDRAGTWVRVATPLAPIAGANWGSHALPRVGQEVLVDFLEGNIDRPVVIGAVYNGAGQPDAQHNRMAYGGGAATGNAPMWFPGAAPGHAHPATLSGIKSQGMRTSQSGAGAYSQLVFDDTPGEARIALQRHADAHRGTAELNLGHVRHQTDNRRLAVAGLGAELKTEHGVAVRAGAGMLLSADRAGSGHMHLDSTAAARQIDDAARLQVTLAGTAQKQNARLPSEPDPDKLPAIESMRASAEVVQAYTEPHLQLSAPAGIAATTPADAVFSAGTTTSLSAGQALNFAAQGNWHHAVRAGISLFTYGKAGSADKPGQDAGIRLHAASGKVSSQSQSGATRITADKLVTVASITKTVSVAAREHVLLTAQGAYLRIQGGNIEVHGPGKIEFKAGMKELAGPANASFAGPELPAAKSLFDEQFVLVDKHTGEPMGFVPYRIEGPDGFVVHGVTDEHGHTERVHTGFKRQLLKLFFDG